MDHRLLWGEISEESVNDGLQFYTTFFNAPPAIKVCGVDLLFEPPGRCLTHLLFVMTRHYSMVWWAWGSSGFSQSCTSGTRARCSLTVAA